MSQQSHKLQLVWAGALPVEHANQSIPSQPLRWGGAEFLPKAQCSNWSTERSFSLHVSYFPSNPPNQDIIGLTPEANLLPSYHPQPPRSLGSKPSLIKDTGMSTKALTKKKGRGGAAKVNGDADANPNPQKHPSISLTMSSKQMQTREAWTENKRGDIQFCRRSNAI